MPDTLSQATKAPPLGRFLGQNCHDKCPRARPLWEFDATHREVIREVGNTAKLEWIFLIR